MEFTGDNYYALSRKINKRHDHALRTMEFASEGSDNDVTSREEIINNTIKRGQTLERHTGSVD